MTGDKVMYVSATIGQPLHASACVLNDQDNVREVNVSARKTAWEIKLFLGYNPRSEEFLKGGDVVRLFHAEQEKFLTCDSMCKDLHATHSLRTIDLRNFSCFARGRLYPCAPFFGG